MAMDNQCEGQVRLLAEKFESCSTSQEKTRNLSDLWPETEVSLSVTFSADKSPRILAILLLLTDASVLRLYR